MGAAWYVVLERKVEGIDSSLVDGKALARHHAELDELARDAGHAALSGFVSAAAAELLDLVGDVGSGEVGAPPEERWFAPEGALTVVSAILPHVRERAHLTRATADLEALEETLRAAAKGGVRFHLAIDV